MNTFALFRLPYAHSYIKIEQTSGEPEQLCSCCKLNGRQGFVVAPFHVSDDDPILLIHPDVVSTFEIGSGTGVMPNIVSVEDNHDDYVIDFANFHAQLCAEVFRKIVLSRSAAIRLDRTADVHHLFSVACNRYPRLFIALVKLPDNTYWLTATPEILLEGIGRQWRTIALAGTMQLTGEELKGEGETMRWSTKNIQEQRYVATYIAECLERFALDFTEEGPRTVRAANLVHLRSDFTFTLPDNAPVGDLLDSLHPTPAVCGLPKQEALRFILQNEHTPRQYYSGFMGPLGMNDETHLYVSLRCMHIQKEMCRLYAGGGLLKDSLPDLEWQETEAKMQTMRTLFSPLS